MSDNEINLRVQRQAVNDVLDHVIEDLKIDVLRIEPPKDFYWGFEPPELYNVSKSPGAYRRPSD
jgi:hypothetical protein